MATMRVRITQCNDPQMWYSGMIGAEFTVTAEEADLYWTREPSGYVNLILKNDAEVIAESLGN